jgi:hypothetical protein
MNDDEFSGFISSGKKMRVSVSERTGNAKTPKNIVTSDENETLNKVRMFEGKEGEFDPLAHNLAEDQNLRLDKFVTQPSEGVDAEKAFADKASEENLQAVKQEPSVNNTQAAPSTSATPANKQSVQTTAAKANLQSVTTDTLKDNLQGIPTEKFEENKQALPASSSVDKNTQSIPSTNVDTNIQSISNPQVASQKPEGIAKEPIHTNGAGIAKENIQDQNARIEKERVNSNSASIHGDATSNNNEAIESASLSDNLASIPKETHHETRQALDKDSFQDRDATVAKTSLDGNVQAVPTEPSIGDNLQPVDHKPIADHFEALPKDARPLGESATPKIDPIGNKASPKPLQSVTAKVAVTQAKKPIAKPQKIGASSAISSAEAQKIALAHKAQMEAFHGRLAGIKNNVDDLNHKLDDLENKS